MVSKDKPNARETPSRPIPPFGEADARTALPQPPKTSQNVPINSAADPCFKDTHCLLCLLSSSRDASQSRLQTSSRVVQRALNRVVQDQDKNGTGDRHQ